MANFGVSMFPTDYAIQPVELALAVEERGFESMFFPEHTHIPATCPRSTGTRIIRSSRSPHAHRSQKKSNSAPAYALLSSATRSRWPRRSHRST